MPRSNQHDKPKPGTYSTSEYAAAVGRSTVAVWKRIQNQSLPEGVTVKRFGRMYVITVS